MKPLFFAFLFYSLSLFSKEVVFIPYASVPELVFSSWEVHPFELKSSWSVPGKSYSQLKPIADRIYDFLKRDIHLTDEEIVELRRIDSELQPGFFAYIVSFLPNSDVVRGIARLSFSETSEQKFFFPVFTIPKLSLNFLPDETGPSKKALLKFNREKFGARAMLARLYCDHPLRAGRVHILVQMVRACILFLKQATPKMNFLVESASPLTTKLYEGFGMKIVEEAPMPEGRVELWSTGEQAAATFLTPFEENLMIPKLIDIYSEEGELHVLEKMTASPLEISKGIQRSLGVTSYHRVISYIRLKRFADARNELKALIKVFGEEPPLLALELELEARSRVDFWQGTGDIGALRNFLLSPHAVERYDLAGLPFMSSWNERLFWMALGELAVGNSEMAKQYRAALGNFGGVDTMAGDSIESVDHAKFQYHIAPLGLSRVFLTKCARFLRESQNPLALTFENRIKDLSD